MLVSAASATTSQLPMVLHCVEGCAVKYKLCMLQHCQVNTHGRLHDFDPKMGGGGCLLGTGNSWCIVVTHERMHSLHACIITMCTGTTSCTVLGWVHGRALTTYNDEPMQDFGPKIEEGGGGGGGGCYAVGVYLALLRYLYTSISTDRLENLLRY